MGVTGVSPTSFLSQMHIIESLSRGLSMHGCFGVRLVLFAVVREMSRVVQKAYIISQKEISA
jgi:Na+-translocating ferredoxin:NAD+ oxidoreductase RnfA subunit